MVQVRGNQCLNGRCDRNAKVERKTWWHPGCVLGDKTNKRWEHTGSMREGLQTEERVGDQRKSIRESIDDVVKETDFRTGNGADRA